MYFFNVILVFLMLFCGVVLLRDDNVCWICVFSVVIRVRYDWSLLLMVVCKFWLSNFFVGDLIKFVSFWYNNEGLVKVCNSDIIGSGKVGGSFKIVFLVKGRVVDDNFWRVKGRFFNRFILEGLNFNELFVSKFDLIEMFFVFFLVDLFIVLGCEWVFLVLVFCCGFLVGSFFKLFGVNILFIVFFFDISGGVGVDVFDFVVVVDWFVVCFVVCCVIDLWKFGLWEVGFWKFGFVGIGFW